MSQAQAKRHTLWRALGLLEACLWLGLLLTFLATDLLIWGGSAGAVELLRPQASSWWVALARFYLPAAGALGVLLVIAAALLRRPALPRLALQLVAAWVLVAVLWLNRGALAVVWTGQADVGPHRSMLWALGLMLLAVLALAAGLLWLRPWVARVVLLAAVASAWFSLTASVPDRAELPLEFEAASASTGERLLVIGLDGADWDFLDPLIERGELPHLARLRQSGVWGELETIRPTRSAPIWTSVVTGAHHRQHGVVNNSVERLRGSFYRLPGNLPLPRGLGVEWIEQRLRSSGRIAHSTVASFDRRVPTFWTIATVNRSPVDFVNWWASWPAEQILGRMVSDRIHFGRLEAKGFDVGKEHITYPETLAGELARIVMRPEQVTREHALEYMQVSEQEFEQMRTMPYRHHRLKSEFKYFYSMYVSNLRIALELIESGRRGTGPEPDLFVLFRIIDQASHQALQYSELVDDHLGASTEEIAKYGKVVTEAYREADRAVGRLLEAFGEGTVIVLSDHGFALGKRRRGHRLYDHMGSNPPDGMFIAVGDELTKGRVEGLSIYDMMPLFLHLKGWPVASDFVHGVPTMLFRPESLEARPVQTIDSYGSMAPSLPEEGALVADDEMVERLRALGYID